MGLVRTTHYVKVADLWPLDPTGELLLVPMIESRESVNQLASVLNLTDVGALFIGPSDLHANRTTATQARAACPS